MKVLNHINFKEDYTFKYVFGKDSKLNRGALTSLIEDFTNTKVDTLRVLSPELKCGSSYEKNTFFDIYAKFNEGDTIDIEMQMLRKRENLQPRVLYYLSKMLNSQFEKGDEYKHMKECYVLLFADFLMYCDDKLVHDFGLYDENAVAFDEDRNFVHIITVELPKIKNIVLQTDQEKWAYALKYAGDVTKEKVITDLINEKEGIRMAIEAANEISKDELEWFQKYQEERAMIEEASFESEVRAKFEYLAEQRGVEKTRKSYILAVCDILSAEEIARRFNIPVDEVTSIIDENKEMWE